MQVMSWVEPFDIYQTVLLELCDRVTHEFQGIHHLVWNAVRKDHHKLVDYNWDPVDSGCRCCDNELWVMTYRVDPGQQQPDLGFGQVVQILN